MQLDPTFTVGLMSADFGSVYSPDGREHPVLGLTPVYQSSVPTSTPDPTPVVNAGLPSILNPFSGIGSLFSGQHVGARLIVGIVGIGLVFIVALRLTR